MMGRHMRTLGTAVAAGGCAAVLAVGGAGTAGAELNSDVVPMDQPCIGLSPYIVDQPFAFSQVYVLQDTEVPGQAKIDFNPSSLWFFAGGYASDFTMDWTNLQTGASGTVRDSMRVANPGSNATQGYVIDSGPGDVALTFNSFNHHQLWGFPSITCHGTIRVD
ncbi:hypothetical protein [Tomitella cavernea]|uniref:Uncharacterized protein n=1 Tax=Tomitella cavernea TaxID=1387982 RepID=A0ABP9C8K2_9ACTN|nr:hypothetical protein [Tomitella cavernea]